MVTKKKEFKSMKQSIIIPYYKNKNELYFMLDLLLQYTPSNVEVIIVANNPNESETDISYLNCKVLRYNQALLYSKAANIGVNFASGEIITLVDQDIFVTKGWYDVLLNKLLSKSSIGAVSPKMLNPTNNRVIEFGIEYAPCNSAHIGKNMLSNLALTQDDICVSSACGGVLMTYKSLYTELNGMDEDMPYICCDCDYTLKLWELEKEVWIAADSNVFHKSYTSTQTGKIADFSYLENDSRWKFYQKNSGRMRYHLDHWMKQTFNFYLSNHTTLSKYIFINLSSYINIEWYINFIKKNLHIDFFDTYTFLVSNRDTTNLQLHDYVPYDFMSLHTPIIYFVDTFISLRDNALWYKIRNTDGDIIIDINGAICSVQELLEESY